MFFTRLASIAAWLALAFGVLRLAAGVIVAGSPDQAALGARYLGSASSGQAIDQGVMVILFAISLGTLAEIGRALRRD